MRWTPSGRGNIDDLRGSSGGGMGRVPMGIGGILVLLVLSWFTGIDFMSLLGNDAVPQSESTTGSSGPVNATPQEEETMDFVNAVIEDTQVTWGELLGGRYERTRAVVFRMRCNRPVAWPSQRSVLFTVRATAKCTWT